MSHRLRAEGLPVKCLPPPPQDPVPEGEDVGTLLDWDGEQQCWLHDGMLHRKRVQVSKHCSELLAPLLCSSPIPYWVVVLCLSFLALILCPFPSSLPQFQRRVRIPLARKAADCSHPGDWGLLHPTLLQEAKNLRRRAAAREGPASAASWCPLALPVPSGSQLARN